MTKKRASCVKQITLLHNERGFDAGRKSSLIILNISEFEFFLFFLSFKTFDTYCPECILKCINILYLRVFCQTNNLLHNIQLYNNYISNKVLIICDI